MTQTELGYITQYWLSWLAHEKLYSKKTVESYRIDLSYFLNFVSGHLGKAPVELSDLMELTLASFRSWLVHRSRENLSISSTKRAISVVRNFYKWLDRQGYGLNSTIFELRSPKAEQRLPKALAQEDAVSASHMIDSMAEEPWVQARDGAVLMLLYGCGLRIGEVLGLNCNSLPLTSILTITGKANKTREVPVIKPVLEALQIYVDLCPFVDNALESNSPLFVGVRGKRLQPAVYGRQLKKLRTSLGLHDSATSHAYRHSYATHLLEEDVDLRTIQTLLGHAQLSTTQIYTKIQDRHLQDSYLNAHPREKDKTL